MIEEYTEEDLKTLAEMRRVVEWLRIHGTISHEDDTLVCGRYKDIPCRIFLYPDDAYAGIQSKPGSFKNAWACYTLKQFMDVLERKTFGVELDDADTEDTHGQQT